MWAEAASWWAGSDGSFWSHCDRSPDQLLPPASTGWVAPVERTALSSCCMPAACQPDEVRHPLSQHDQEMSWGSLYRSKTTPGSDLKVVATEVQNAGEWS